VVCVGGGGGVADRRRATDGERGAGSGRGGEQRGRGGEQEGTYLMHRCVVHTSLMHRCGVHKPDASRRRTQVLDAFFVGRALADVVNEKLGTALGEVLSEVAKVDAERRRELKDFQEEVRLRARDQQTKATASAVQPSIAPADDP
jgi:hypothetical protein